jgi:hypothetical protein
MVRAYFIWGFGFVNIFRIKVVAAGKRRFAFRFKMYYLCIAEKEVLPKRVMPPF